MSIAPPSDIVLDVARAADPQRLEAATAKLARLAAGAAGPDAFASQLKTMTDKIPASPLLSGTTLGAGSPPAVRSPTSPYEKFEALVLQTFVQDILPKDENLFGDAASADACRSLLAEQVSMQLAKSGKLGIARMIQSAHPPTPAAAADVSHAAALENPLGTELAGTSAAALGGQIRFRKDPT